MTYQRKFFKTPKCAVKTLDKLGKVVESCETDMQYMAAKNMLINFLTTYYIPTSLHFQLRLGIIIADLNDLSFFNALSNKDVLKDLEKYL